MEPHPEKSNREQKGLKRRRSVNRPHGLQPVERDWACCFIGTHLLRSSYGDATGASLPVWQDEHDTLLGYPRRHRRTLSVGPTWHCHHLMIAAFGDSDDEAGHSGLQQAATAERVGVGAR